MREQTPSPVNGVRIFFVLLAMTLALLFQASARQIVFPFGGGPDVVLAFLLVVGQRMGLVGAVLTGFWGGLVVGALSGSGAASTAALYLGIGWMVGIIRESRGNLGPLRSLLLAAGLAVVATVSQAYLAGGLSMWRCALTSLAPQMFVQACVVTINSMLQGFV